MISCDGYDFEMEDKGNADRVGKDKAFATELLVSSTLALDDMTTEKIREIKPDLVVSDSVAFWGKLAAMKHGLPYVSSTTTFAFNRFSAKYMKETPWDIAKMLFSMPRINKQIRRLREKGYPVKGILKRYISPWEPSTRTGSSTGTVSIRWGRRTGRSSSPWGRIQSSTMICLEISRSMSP